MNGYSYGTSTIITIEEAAKELEKRLKEIDNYNEVERTLYQEASAHVLLNVYLAGELASQVTNRLFCGQGDEPSVNLDGTIANAFRHALWNALMTEAIGVDTAKEFADAHEYEAQFVYPDSEYLRYTQKAHSDMDLYYNKVGRDVAVRQASGNFNDTMIAVLKAVVAAPSHVLIFDYGYKLSEEGMCILK